MYCRVCISLPSAANPITTPAVEKTKCMVKSTNIQFRYETEQELERQLRHDYGNVSWNDIILFSWVKILIFPYI